MIRAETVMKEALRLFKGEVSLISLRKRNKDIDYERILSVYRSLRRTKEMLKQIKDTSYAVLRRYNLGKELTKELDNMFKEMYSHEEEINVLGQNIKIIRPQFDSGQMETDFLGLNIYVQIDTVGKQDWHRDYIINEEGYYINPTDTFRVRIGKEKWLEFYNGALKEEQKAYANAMNVPPSESYASIASKENFKAFEDYINKMAEPLKQAEITRKFTKECGLSYLISQIL